MYPFEALIQMLPPEPGKPLCCKYSSCSTLEFEYVDPDNQDWLADGVSDMISWSMPGGLIESLASTGFTDGIYLITGLFNAEYWQDWEGEWDAEYLFDFILIKKIEEQPQMQMKELKELEQRVITWAENKGIYGNSTPSNQLIEGVVEVGEFWEEFKKGDLEKAKMELGDIMVFRTNGMQKFNNVSPIHISLLLRIVSNLVSKETSDETWYEDINLFAETFLASTAEECFEMAVSKIEKRKHKGFVAGKLEK